jgi:hypothetical protein
MAAFNVLHATVPCPNCGTTVDLELQFRYGDTWQHLYKVGDRVRWGGNDVGTPGRRRVLVEAIGGPCPRCGSDNLDFTIVIENDVIQSVEPAQAEPLRTADERYLVVDP